MRLDFYGTGLDRYMLDGEFGLERETLRVNAEGFLSHTPHPFPDDPNISRDFCENQIEIITSVSKGAKGAIEELSELDRKVTKTLLELDTGREYLWRFSNPPFVKGEDDIPIAHFSGDEKHKEEYREYLAGKYGKMKMLFSGIHCNFSFSDEFVSAAFRQSGYDDLRAFKNDLYLRLGGSFAQYSWLIVYLTAASPVADNSFLDYNTSGSRYSSPRCSEIGYWNDFVPVLSYDSIESYVQSINAYISEGKLLSASELYYPVRLKPAGENSLDSLIKNGINHIELRMLDVDPLCPVGIFETDLDFLQLMAVYLTSLDNNDLSESAQINAVKNMKAAALYDHERISISTDNGRAVNIKTAALAVIEDMERFFSQLEAPKEVGEILRAEKAKIEDPSRRYAEIVRSVYGEDYIGRGMKLSEDYARLYSDKKSSDDSRLTAR